MKAYGPHLQPNIKCNADHKQDWLTKGGRKLNEYRHLLKRIKEKSIIKRKTIHAFMIL